MKKVFVSGLCNIETTLKIEKFPLEYFPVTYPFNGITSSVSGVGINISKAFSILETPHILYTLIGRDAFGKMVTDDLVNHSIGTDLVMHELDETPQSVILYDLNGKREIHVDLKDLQEKMPDTKLIKSIIPKIDFSILCNINLNRHLIPLFRQENIPIATDVHVLSDPDDTYNRDFIANSDILFFSNEAVKNKEMSMIQNIFNRYHNKIIICGLGESGSLLFTDGKFFKQDAVFTRKVINTIGAGDALFSSFVHFYRKTNDPYLSIKKATIFASYKIGEKGASSGYLNEKKLNEYFTI